MISSITINGNGTEQDEGIEDCRTDTVSQYLGQFFNIETSDGFSGSGRENQSVEWVELDPETLSIDIENWEEIDEYEGDLDNWPRWFMRLLSGDGDFQQFFSRWADNE